MTTTIPNQTPPLHKSTALALIEAAERLFGQHGIDAVSLRQIRLEACAGNNSAVSYHFRDREKLVRAIWDYRLPMLEDLRRPMLERLIGEGRQQDPDALLRVLLLPNYELRDTQGQHRYAAFFRHALRWKNGTAIRNAQLHTTPASAKAMQLFYALRPDLTPALMDYRLRHATCMFFDMSVERDTEISNGMAVIPEADFLAEGIAKVGAVCLRPPIRN